MDQYCGLSATEFCLAMPALGSRETMRTKITPLIDNTTKSMAVINQAIQGATRQLRAPRVESS
jgi:hypothetical protein